MLLGLRGVGKTVLVNRLHQSAIEKGFRAIKVEARESVALPEAVTIELSRILAEFDLAARASNTLRKALSAIRNFASIFKVSYEGFEFGASPSPGPSIAKSGDLERDLPELLGAAALAAQERDTGIAVFIDEVQYLDRSELSAVIVACHDCAQLGLPMLFVGAGLPQIAALAGNAKSYAERLFDYPEVGALSDAAATQALRNAAIGEGADFEDAAIHELRRVTGNYPYFLQEWGYHVWNAADGPTIRLNDVTAAAGVVVDHLDANFFRVRFDRCTPLQQKYLRAMAELGAGPHKTGDIAAVLECEPQAVAPTRAKLIALGMIWSQRHAETSFTAPLFDDFMRRQMPNVEPHRPRRRRAKKDS